MEKFYRNGKQVLAYANGVPCHFADATSEDAAQGIVDTLNATRTNYVDLALTTLSDQFHGEMVGRAHFIKTLNIAIDSLTALDMVKKTLFYGRDNNLAADAGQRDCSGLLSQLVASNTAIEGGFTPADAANYIHGIIGLATEAGELLENLKNAINGHAIDRTNVKEEVGDGKWYMAILANVGQFGWGDDEAVNIAKLRARFPDAFTEHHAVNRDLDAERAILEGEAVYDPRPVHPSAENHLPINERSTKMPGERNLDGDAIEAQKPTG